MIEGKQIKVANLIDRIKDIYNWVNYIRYTWYSLRIIIINTINVRNGLDFPKIINRIDQLYECLWKSSELGYCSCLIAHRVSAATHPHPPANTNNSCNVITKNRCMLLWMKNQKPRINTLAQKRKKVKNTVVRVISMEYK